jgi:hypothetical protein
MPRQQTGHGGIEATIHPSGTTVVIERRLGPWLITFGWGGNEDKAGPTHMTITFADELDPDDEAELYRGINTGTLRRIEPLLLEASAHVRERLAPVLRRAQRQYAAAIDEARRHPIIEDREAYYTALHAAWQALVASGDRAPNRTLAQRLGLSPETIRTQLKKARKQAANPERT